MAIDNHAKPSRKLPYPVSQSLVVDGIPSTTDIVQNVAPDFFPADPDAKINVSFNLSLNEFVTIASAIDIGRDIGYGEQSYEVWRLWCKALIGEVVMSCADAADCIEEQLAINPETLEPVNPQFYNSITNTINQQGYGNPNRINPTVTKIIDRQSPDFANTEIGGKLANCDLDSLWAWIRHGVVARLDDNARDLLEDLAVLNDVPQRYQAFIDVVPVLGDVAEGIATAATEVIPDILNGFNSYSSEAQLDAIACDIFGMVCAECRYPTYEEVFTYYASLGYDLDSMDAMTLVNVVSSLSAMIAGAVPAQMVYHTAIAFQLFVLYVQAKFNNESGTQAIARMGTLGEDYANNNWLQLCATCNEQWQIEYFDFTQSPSGWKLNPSIGISAYGGHWVAGSGWVWDTSGNGQFASITYDIDPSFRIRGIGFNYTGVVDVAASGITLRPTPSSNTGAANQNLSAGTTYNRSNCLLTAQQGYRQVVMGIKAGDANPAYIEKAFIVYDAGYGRGNRAASRAVC